MKYIALLLILFSFLVTKSQEETTYEERINVFHRDLPRHSIIIEYNYYDYWYSYPYFYHYYYYHPYYSWRYNYWNYSSWYNPYYRYPYNYGYWNNNWYNYSPYNYSYTNNTTTVNQHRPQTGTNIGNTQYSHKRPNRIVNDYTKPKPNSNYYRPTNQQKPTQYKPNTIPYSKPQQYKQPYNNSRAVSPHGTLPIQKGLTVKHR